MVYSSYMNRKDFNKLIKPLNIELQRGKGYLYFTGEKISHLPETSVAVPYFKSLSPNQWFLELRDLLNKARGDDYSFNVGDKVFYINDYGVYFNHFVVTKIREIKEGEDFLPDNKYFLNWDCQWYPTSKKGMFKLG